MQTNFNTAIQPYFGQAKKTEENSQTIDIKDITFRDGIPFCKDANTPYSGIIESTMSDGGIMKMHYNNGRLTKKERIGNTSYCTKYKKQPAIPVSMIDTVKQCKPKKEQKLPDENVAEITKRNEKGTIIEYRTEDGSIVELDRAKRKSKETKPDGTVITWNYKTPVTKFQYEVKYDYSNSTSAEKGLLYEIKERGHVNYPERTIETGRTDGSTMYRLNANGDIIQGTRGNGVISFYSSNEISREETETGLTFKYNQQTLSKKGKDGATEVFDISNRIEEIKNMSDDEKKNFDTSQLRMAKIELEQDKIQEVEFSESGEISKIKFNAKYVSSTYNSPHIIEYLPDGRVKLQLFKTANESQPTILYKDAYNVNDLYPKVLKEYLDGNKLKPEFSPTKTE